MDRRAFLSSLFAATALATARRVLAQKGGAPRRRVGLIGCGWYGNVNLLRLVQVENVNVVALCDVDRTALRETARRVRALQDDVPVQYADYRDMVAGASLDIVIVATPDHWHALPAIEAIRAGVHVYLEKPVSVDVVEGEALVAAARKYRRVVQVGLQRRSMPHLVDARARVVEAGLLGRIGLAEGFCYLNMGMDQTLGEAGPPDGFDYDMWTGPAPLRPYVSGVHPRGWRMFAEYGNGIVGDMGVHVIDMVRWMLGLGWPRGVYSTGGVVMQRGDAGNIADTQLATFDFGAVRVDWRHRTWGGPPHPDLDWTRRWGAVIHGEFGTLRLTSVDWSFRSSRGGDRLEGVAVEDAMEQADASLDAIDRSAAVAERRHMRDFLDAIDRGTRSVADISEGHVSTAACVLANLSMRLGRPVAYDPEARSVPGDVEATRLLRRAYRLPWRHPESYRV